MAFSEQDSDERGERGAGGLLYLGKGIQVLSKDEK